MKKLLFLGLILIISLALVQAVYAQDTALEDQVVEVTDEVTAADLEISEPTVLPTNTFGYFFKNLGRTIQTVVTFNKQKKAELQLRYANERLLEAKKMAELNPDDVKVQKKIEKNHEKYQKLMAKVHERVQKIKAKNDDRAENLIDKVMKEEFKQQQLMENIQEKVKNISEEQKEKLEQHKEKALEKYGNFIEKVEEDKDKIKERFERVLEKGKEDKMDHLKDLEIMERLGDKFEDENLKEGLIESKEKLRSELVDYLNERPDISEAERFELKLKELGDDEAYKLRVMDFVGDGIKEKAKTNWQINKFNIKLEGVKKEGINYLQEELENADSDEARNKLLKPLEAGEMHSVDVLERVKAKISNPRAKEALEHAQEKQTEQFNRRIENIEDSERLEKLRNEINARPAVKRDIQKAEPQIMNRLQENIRVRMETAPMQLKSEATEPARVQQRIDEPVDSSNSYTGSNSSEDKPFDDVDYMKEPLREDRVYTGKLEVEPVK